MILHKLRTCCHLSHVVFKSFPHMKLSTSHKIFDSWFPYMEILIDTPLMYEIIINMILIQRHFYQKEPCNQFTVKMQICVENFEVQ